MAPRPSEMPLSATISAYVDYQAAAVAVRARARLLPSYPSVQEERRRLDQILAKSTLLHKTVHSPAVGKFGAHLPHTPPSGRNDASRVPPPQKKGAMWDGIRRRPSTRDDEKKRRLSLMQRKNNVFKSKEKIYGCWSRDETRDTVHGNFLA